MNFLSKMILVGYSTSKEIFCHQLLAGKLGLILLIQRVTMSVSVSHDLSVKFYKFPQKILFNCFKDRDKKLLT